MSKVDVSDLERDQLPAASFPASMRAAFRLHLAPEVHRGIEAHAKADPSVEICGVLVGGWGQDEEGPFAQVTDYIRCDNAASKLAEVTFTHESWAQINHEMDTKYADKRIVGWYHSHPDFGIFLSDRDCFIHEHFFSGAGQVAYVVDPVRDQEGVFSWQKGKPTPMSHFWVGSQIRTGQTSQRSPSREGGGMPRAASEEAILAEAAAMSPLPARAPLSTAMTLLAWICLFLLGYGCADWRTRTEQQMIVEGAVAHYGFQKVMKLGLEQDLAKVRQALRAIESELGKLPKVGDKLSEKDVEQAEKQRELLGDSLLLTERALGQIQEEYSLSKDELAVYAQLVAQKQAELKQLMDRAQSNAAPPKTAPAAPSAGPTADQPSPRPKDSSEPARSSPASSTPTSDAKD